MSSFNWHLVTNSKVWWEQVQPEENWAREGKGRLWSVCSWSSRFKKHKGNFHFLIISGKAHHITAFCSLTGKVHVRREEEDAKLAHCLKTWRLRDGCYKAQKRPTQQMKVERQQTSAKTSSSQAFIWSYTKLLHFSKIILYPPSRFFFFAHYFWILAWRIDKKKVLIFHGQLKTTSIKQPLDPIFMLIMISALVTNNLYFLLLLLKWGGITFFWRWTWHMGSCSLSWSTFHFTFSWYLPPNFGSLVHTLKSISYSEESFWQTNAWKYTATIREEKMQCYLFCEMLLCHCFFCCWCSVAAAPSGTDPPLSNMTPLV